MSRNLLTIVLLLFVTGCSLTRRSGSSYVIDSGVTGTSLGTPDYQNISKSAFNISKAEIEISENGEKSRLLAYMKYRTPGDYLISIRGRSGIEAARIYMTTDTVMINDRINKKLYIGSSRDLAGKYGITGDEIPVVTGDFIADEASDKVKVNCDKGKAFISTRIENKKIEYTFDCRLNKPVRCKIYDDKGNQGLEFQYAKFIRVDSKTIPGTIIINDFLRETNIKIEIKKIDFQDKEPLNFIPGRGYEKIILR